MPVNHFISFNVSISVLLFSSFTLVKHFNFILAMQSLAGGPLRKSFILGLRRGSPW